MKAIENRMLELVPDAATKTLSSNCVRGNGVTVIFNVRSGLIMSLKIASWISTA